MEIEELKKFKDEIYGKLGEIIKKEVKQQENEKNLQVISIERREKRDEGDIPEANRIHKEEYMPLYEDNEKLKQIIVQDKQSIEDRIKEEEKVLKEKENEFNLLSMKRRELRDDDNILEANQLHKEKIEPLYEEIEKYRDTIEEMKNLTEKERESFENVEQTVTKYNEERMKEEQEKSHYESLAKELEEQAKYEKIAEILEKQAKEKLEDETKKQETVEVIEEPQNSAELIEEINEPEKLKSEKLNEEVQVQNKISNERTGFYKTNRNNECISVNDVKQKYIKSL